MKSKHKKLIAAVSIIGASVAVASGIVLYKLMKDDYFSNKSKAKDAKEYLIEKYGEEALQGKKIIVVDEDKPVTRTRIAKDILQYRMQ